MFPVCIKPCETMVLDAKKIQLFVSQGYYSDVVKYVLREKVKIYFTGSTEQT